jgi:hypothetical protein
MLDVFGDGLAAISFFMAVSAILGLLNSGVYQTSPASESSNLGIKNAFASIR